MSLKLENGIATADLVVIIEKLSSAVDTEYDWSGVHVYINGKEMNLNTLSIELGNHVAPVVKINEVLK